MIRHRVLRDPDSATNLASALTFGLVKPAGPKIQDNSAQAESDSAVARRAAILERDRKARSAVNRRRTIFSSAQGDLSTPTLRKVTLFGGTQ